MPMKNTSEYLKYFRARSKLRRATSLHLGESEKAVSRQFTTKLRQTHNGRVPAWWFFVQLHVRKNRSLDRRAGLSAVAPAREPLVVDRVAEEAVAVLRELAVQYRHRTVQFAEGQAGHVVSRDVDMVAVLAATGDQFGLQFGGDLLYDRHLWAVHCRI